MTRNLVKLPKKTTLSNRDFERAYLGKKAPKVKGKPLTLKSKNELSNPVKLRDALRRDRTR